MSSEPSGRLERRKERTRRALLQAGRRSIMDVGVAGLRIQEVTQAADVGLGSFYTYFSSKDDFVQAIVSDSLEQLASAMAQGQSGNSDPAVVTTEAVRRAIRLAFDEPEFARLLVNLDHSEALFADAMRPQASTVVARGIAEGRFDTPDIELTVNYILSGTLSLIRQILEGQHSEGVEVAQAEIALRILGLGHDEARRMARFSDKLPETPDRADSPLAMRPAGQPN